MARTDAQRQQAAAYQRVWRQTAAGQAYVQRENRKPATEQRRQQKAAAQRKYRTTEKGQAVEQHHNANRERRNAYQREWNRSERGQMFLRARRLAKAGFTEEMFSLRWDQQMGRCAICQTPLDEGYHMDHDHEANEPRGLLCNLCNPGIGYFKDDPALLRAAADYLESFQQ